jgi:hypothetical protein
MRKSVMTRGGKTLPRRDVPGEFTARYLGEARGYLNDVKRHMFRAEWMFEDAEREQREGREDLAIVSLGLAFDWIRLAQGSRRDAKRCVRAALTGCSPW